MLELSSKADLKVIKYEKRRNEHMAPAQSQGYGSAAPLVSVGKMIPAQYALRTVQKAEAANSENYSQGLLERLRGNARSYAAATALGLSVAPAMADGVPQLSIRAADGNVYSLHAGGLEADKAWLAIYNRRDEIKSLLPEAQRGNFETALAYDNSKLEPVNAKDLSGLLFSHNITLPSSAPAITYGSPTTAAQVPVWVYAVGAVVAWPIVWRNVGRPLLEAAGALKAKGAVSGTPVVAGTNATKPLVIAP